MFNSMQWELEGRHQALIYFLNFQELVEILMLTFLRYMPLISLHSVSVCVFGSVTVPAINATSLSPTWLVGVLLC